MGLRIQVERQPTYQVVIWYEPMHTISVVGYGSWEAFAA
jgi:hypothetical protein